MRQKILSVTTKGVQQNQTSEIRTPSCSQGMKIVLTRQKCLQHELEYKPGNLQRHQLKVFSSPKTGSPEKGSISRPKSSVECWECIMDSGASLHMVGRSSLRPEELKTETSSINLCLIVTASGTVETNEEGTVHIGDMNIFANVKLQGDSRGLSLCMLFEMIGSSSWTAGEQQSLIKDWVTLNCGSEKPCPGLRSDQADRPSRAMRRRLHARLVTSVHGRLNRRLTCH